jgi:hypothetical protein
VGEVGIDCSEGAKPFGIQRSTLKWVLALAQPYIPLVFHIRASGDSPQATDASYREVLGLTQDKVPNTLQSIHLHCFNGDEATVKLWSDAYPGTYFGFSSMVKGFGDRQRQGLKAVPGNRLLLESDSSPRCGRFHQPPGSFVQGGGGGRSGEGSVSFGRPPGRYCQWAGSVPEEVVRLAQRGEFKITERGGVKFWVFGSD